jgi:chemotaxis signal transduction protein/nucleoid-associated protein YgaU
MRELLLFHFGNVQYGVWEDELSSLRGALPLHHLPLSPPAIAGIAILEERSAVFADLGACLGLPPLKRLQGGTFLMINANDTIAGFCVEGEPGRFACPRELVLPLPPAVATPVADTCAMPGAWLVPVINIRSLHDRLQQGLLGLPSPEPGPQGRAIDLSAVRSVRMLSVGGARFCVDAEDTEYAALGESGIAQVPVRSRRLAGVALHDGAVVPVMLPGAFSDLGKPAGRKGLLLAGPQGARYGIAVDQDLGVVEGQDLRLLALPVLAAKPWLPAAALVKEKICLLVDSSAFTAPEDTAGERQEQAIFTPASLFPAQFRKSDTAIVEFSLLGTRHAVPQEEMKDDLAALPFVPVPGTPEIVRGVAELQGELLPVLDLAATFGRRSLIGKTSRMMHLVNGDFHALVITDEVTGSRHLPVETQRQVPIALPHQVLYGCYLDAGMVRLILNVEALAVHFEKAAVRELVAGLSPDIEVQPSQAQEAPDKAAPVPRAAETVQKPEEAPRSEQEKVAVTAEHETEPAPTAAGDAIPAAALAAVLEEERIQEEARLKAVAEAAAREQARQRVEAQMRRAEDEARSRAAEQARLKAEADAKALEDKRLQMESERARAEAEARARAEAEAQAREAARRKAAEEAANKAVEEARKRQEEEEQTAEQARAAAAAAEKQTAEEAEQRAMAQRAAQENISPETPTASTVLQPTMQTISGDQQPARRNKGKHIGIAAIIAAILVLIIYSTRSPITQVAPPIAEKAQPQSVQKPSPPPDEAKQARQGTPEDVLKSLPKPEKLAPLYLTVPPDRVMPDQTVYIVVKGDTLWGIAKRFTGNPLNYPRVAKDNSIATPDLIFPGQRIRLVQEKR